METERDTISKEEAKKIHLEYCEMFDDYLPDFPMIQCTGYEDERYLKMLQYAMSQKRPVTQEDEEMFFPRQEGALY